MKTLHVDGKVINNVTLRDVVRSDELCLFMEHARKYSEKLFKDVIDKHYDELNELMQEKAD